MSRKRVATVAALGVLAVGLAGALAVATAARLAPTPASLDLVLAPGADVRVVARDGTALSRSYSGRWNVHDRLPLHLVPSRLQAAFVHAEDARFHDHAGVDWLARAHAGWQNLRAGGLIRGASTITEQAVRILTPRPRSVWSRWLEHIEARRLDARFSKAEILEFYLDQVPFASNRRGVAQAARHYFDRAVDTLSDAEMLALAVLVRAPSRFDLHRGQEPALRRVKQLARRMHAAGALDAESLARVLAASALALARPGLEVHAPHFVRYVRARAGVEQASRGAPIRTSLDADLQRHVQALLARRIADLGPRRVAHGAALVVEHGASQIRAWAVGGRDDGRAGTGFDAVRVPRQPGSTLKPFVYALALERGWTAATQIDDAPLAESVGRGMHAYRNYSRVHYGPVSVREALGNSLNVPAVKALQHVGGERVLERLRAFGLESLDAHPQVYGDGLALGNGEVSLYELVGAYAALARGGIHVPLGLAGERGTPRRVLSHEIASIVADILADPDARALEFSRGGVLSLPIETAIKTGTSSDHRDAWVVGFDHRHTVGVWLGNLDRAPMDAVTGASGPALVLREIFAQLNRHAETAPLPRSRRLVRRAVCARSGAAADGACAARPELFVPGTEPGREVVPSRPRRTRIRQPGPGLDLAMDPRIPDALERFTFALTDGQHYERVRWFVDGELAGESAGPTWGWPVAAGRHRAHAEVWLAGANRPLLTDPVEFRVVGP